MPTAKVIAHVAEAQLAGMAVAVAVLQGQIIEANGSFFMQCLHGTLVGGLVTEDADFPEFLANEIFARVVEQLEHERVDVGDLAGGGIEDEDAVVGGFEEAAVADFGGADE